MLILTLIQDNYISRSTIHDECCPLYSSSVTYVIPAVCHPCHVSSPPCVVPTMRRPHHASSLPCIIPAMCRPCHASSLTVANHRLVVLCDTALAVVVVQETAHCHPASRGSQQQCRACVGYLYGLCVLFGGWAMSLSRCRNLKMKKSIS
jgi:hypothetical protein